MRKQVRKLRNLTDYEVCCYGTSGELVRLKPEAVKPNEVVKLGQPEDGTLYVADDGTYLALFRSHFYHDKVVDLRFIGSARKGEDLYKFTDIFGNEVKLITEGVVSNPVVDRRHYIQFAYNSNDPRWGLTM